MGATPVPRILYGVQGTGNGQSDSRPECEEGEQPRADGVGVFCDAHGVAEDEQDERTDACRQHAHSPPQEGRDATAGVRCLSHGSLLFDVRGLRRRGLRG